MGDYSRKLDRFADISTGTPGGNLGVAQITASDSGTKVAVPLQAGFTLYIQRILVSVFTDAAQSLTFQDSADTPIVIAKTKASPGLGPILFDFGPDGYPLTESKELDCVISGAGLAVAISITGYARHTATSQP